jgi:Zn-dependent alcohol dehydrogenase
MKAAVLTELEFNQPLTIMNVTVPDNLWHGQVLVKLIVSGICGAQLQEIAGHKGNTAHIPHMLGHEGCGIVQAVGPDVTNVKQGDKVVMHWRKGEGCDSEPAVYSDGITAGHITTFSELAIVSANRVTKVPDDLPADLGALLGCALSTALATIENVAKVKFGESVLVVGCGGVGLSLILAAKLAHAHPIVGVDYKEAKKIWTEALGAIFSFTPPRLSQFDVIIDTSGQMPFLEHLAPSGRYIMVGQPIPYSTIYIHRAHTMFNGTGLSIQATQGGNFNPTLDIPRYVRLWRSGALDDYRNLISHRVDLERINAGIDWVRDGQAARVMVDIS